MNLSLTLRAWGSRLLYEGHGFSRAVVWSTNLGLRVCVRTQSQSHRTHALYQGTTSVVPWSFYILPG